MKNPIIVRSFLPGQKKKSTGLVSLLALLGAAGALTAAPVDITQSVTYNGETITLRLKRQTVRGAYFELKAQDASGAYNSVTPVDERSYLGTVDQYPGAISAGILKDDGTFRGAVIFDRGGTWFTLGSAVTGTRGTNVQPNYRFPTVQLTPGQAGITTYRYDVGYDMNSNAYASTGGTAALAFEEVEYTTALIRAMYLDNAMLRPYLGRVILRTSAASDPMANLVEGNLLGAVTTEWRNNQTSAQRDLVVGLGVATGGIAYAPGFGNTWGYSINPTGGNGATFIYLRHEMAHNWNVGHSDGDTPEGPTINAGNQFARMSTAEIEKMLNSRDSWIGQLVSDGTYTDVNLPPYACMDAVVLNRNTQNSATINVMANDHDANGHAITDIVSFDAVSARGGTVVKNGTGASSTLTFTPAGNVAGNDSFTYKIVDSSGQTATGVVIVDINPNDELAGWWKLDEAAGATTAPDSSLSATPGVIESATPGSAGKFGNALSFDGVDDGLKIVGTTLNTNTVTLTTWMKRSTTAQTPWAGIIYHRETSSVPSGLNFGNANELRYTWNSGQWGWNSGLIPPADQWVLVALVIEPTKATIYLHDGTTLQSAVNTATHAAAPFGGTTHLGWDAGVASRRYKGLLDDVRIYRRALSATEITDLVKGGGAESPIPFNGGTGVKSSDLVWTPGINTTSHQIYLGTSQSAVAAATTSSPEYRGSTTSNGWFHALSPSTTYYWSVDSVTPAGTLAGPVWSFTTGSTVSTMLARWNFNAGSGTTATDVEGGNIANLLNGAAWATGYSGSAISFDGVDDVVASNASLLSNRGAFTVAGWYKSSYTSGTVSLFGQNDVVELGLSGGKVSVWTDSGGSVSTPTLPTVNQWHHVTCVGNGTDLRIYVDGVLAVTGGIPTTTYGSSSDPIRIGAGVWASSGNPFNGLIDDVRVYNRALSASEAAALAAGAGL